LSSVQLFHLFFVCPLGCMKRVHVHCSQLLRSCLWNFEFQNKRYEIQEKEKEKPNERDLPVWLDKRQEQNMNECERELSIDCEDAILGVVILLLIDRPLKITISSLIRFGLIPLGFGNLSYVLC
jgi:hypothetical protein